MRARRSREQDRFPRAAAAIAGGEQEGTAQYAASAARVAARAAHGESPTALDRGRGRLLHGRHPVLGPPGGGGGGLGRGERAVGGRDGAAVSAGGVVLLGAEALLRVGAEQVHLEHREVSIR